MSNRPPSPTKSTQPVLQGMQRWFCQVIGQSIPFKYMEYAAHVACGMWTTLVFLAIVFTMGWLWKLPLLVMLIGSVTLYIALVRRGHAMAKDPTIGLEWYQRPFWIALLHASRKLRWSGYDPSISQRNIVDRRSEPVDDAQLAALAKAGSLAECEVLDLEGCPLTDQSLGTIVKQKQLCCLVLIDTDVSEQGVHALQRRMPKLWVWH